MKLAATIEGIGLVGPGLASWKEGREALAGRAAYVAKPTVLPVPEALPATERRRAGKSVKISLAAGLEAALRHNQSLWTFLQAELLEPSSPVPADLRTQLLAISRFVDRRTFEMMGAPWADGLAPLIAVNRQIAAGLATSQAPDHDKR